MQSRPKTGESANTEIGVFPPRDSNLSWSQRNNRPPVVPTRPLKIEPSTTPSRHPGNVHHKLPKNQLRMKKHPTNHTLAVGASQGGETSREQFSIICHVDGV